MTEYTYEQAIEVVLEMKRQLGHMPTLREYKKDNMVNLQGLEKALNTNGFAGVNIEVLREVRRREGRPTRIVEENEIGRMEVKGTMRGEDNNPPRKKRKLKWDEKEVASIIKEFHEKYGRYPKDSEFLQKDETLLSIRSDIPSVITVKKILGGKREDWDKSITRILDDNQESLIDGLCGVLNEDPELISEEERDRYKHISMKQFFDTINAVQKMIEDGTMENIRSTATNFNYETVISAREKGLKLFFVANLDKE